MVLVVLSVVILFKSVVILFKSVRVIFVITLLTLPTLGAQFLSKNFKHIIGWAIFLVIAENFSGIILSYRLNLPTGPLIITPSLKVIGDF